MPIFLQAVITMPASKQSSSTASKSTATKKSGSKPAAAGKKKPTQPNQTRARKKGTTSASKRTTGSNKKSSADRQRAASKRGQKTNSKKPSPTKRRWLKRLGKALAVVAVPFFIVFLYFYIEVVGQFKGRLWDLPARVYSAPVELYAGADIAKDHLLWALNHRGYRSVDQPDSPGEYQLRGTRMHLVSRPFVGLNGQQAGKELIIDFVGQRMTRVVTPDDSGYAQLEPVEIGNIYPGQGEDRLLIQYEQVPATMIDGLVAVEDRSFWWHMGVSPVGIARAFIVNMQTGARTQGGSTLTQQLVKNLYLDSTRSYTRKAIEALMAVALEIRFDKQTIMQTYLNEVFLVQDGNRAIHGIGLASQYLFAKPVNELDIAEQALLIGMVKGPSVYNPVRSPQRAKARRDVVLGVMLSEGVIDQAAYQQAIAKPLALNIQRRSGGYPAFMDIVQQQLQADYDKAQLHSEGLKVYTTFRPWLQETAQTRVAEQLERLARQKNLAEPPQTALVVTQPHTGEVLAALGDRQPGLAGFNRVVDMRRQVGSVIKPAVYLAALARPNHTLISPIADEPISISLPEGGTWEPQNYDNISHGVVPLYQALAKSYNQATARLGMEVGLPAVFDTLQALGVQRDIPRVPSVLLGAVELSPLEVASMYQTIANDGYHSPLTAIRGVLNVQGQLLTQYRNDPQRRVDEQAVHLLHYAMQMVMREGTGNSAYNLLPESLNLQGKTGTTDDQRDAWFAGWSGNFLMVNWVGYDDNRATPFTGSSGALPIWTHVLDSLVPQPLTVDVPSGIEYHWVDPVMGYRTSEGCESAMVVPFLSGTEPQDFRRCGGGRTLSDWLDNWFN
ncbi:penicillin-binding protein 1B [Salinibius halmophilus]|uniref:penicillin-binding protein 1B n=1 Tax=Salinibius halmophilus TaxID=1853216 RepID=UPI001314463A|nr:penicillin-binding protein 1B [Salinibius halmophilus]